MSIARRALTRFLEIGSKLPSALVYVKRCMGSYYNKLYLERHKATIGHGFTVYGRTYIISEGELIIGNNVRIRSSFKSNPIGCGCRTCFQIMRGGKIIIGNHVGISNTAFTCQSNITVHDYAMFGSGCKLFDTDFHPIEPQKRIGGARGRSKPVVIGKYAFIGAGCFILKGVTIGQNSVIGAGSVVSKDVPDNQIWAGNPARYIRTMTQDETMQGCS